MRKQRPGLFIFHAKMESHGRYETKRMKHVRVKLHIFGKAVKLLE